MRIYSALLISSLFICFPGFYCGEYCVTTEGVVFCENGCCGNVWEQNISCCFFHPVVIILAAIGAVLIIVLTAVCIRSCFITKAKIQPEAEFHTDEPFVPGYPGKHGLSSTVISTFSTASLQRKVSVWFFDYKDISVPSRQTDHAMDSTKCIDSKRDSNIELNNVLDYESNDTIRY